ncbi:MAG: hypothetical protein ABR911_12665 [Syntrophales bacterium]
MDGRTWPIYHGSSTIVNEQSPVERVDIYCFLRINKYRKEWCIWWVSI